MQGIEQLMGRGREIGEVGVRLVQHNGGLDALEIVLLVLGLLLWAAVMTTLVMGMIVLVRNLRQTKAAPTPSGGSARAKAEASSKSASTKDEKSKGGKSASS